jgi:hypothetical protein
MRILFLAVLPALCRAGVSLKTWPSTAFACGTPACASSATSTTVPSVQAAPPCAAPCSARFFAMLTAPASELVTFWVVSDGGVNLWVDDHLLVDRGTESGGAPRNLTAELRLPLVAGKVYPIRLDYLRTAGGAPSSLALWWSGNTTAPAVVPAAALSAAPTAAEVARVALKERMLNPPVAWQTFYNPSMGTHVLMPSGFAVQATLADVTTNETLGDIIVFRRSNPAITYVGAHSYNGSDFTELRLDSWGRRDCTVVLRTTVVNGGADLLFLAASNGTACARMALLLTPAMLWARDGRLYAPPAGGAVFAADCPGFPTSSIFPAGAVPQPFPKAGPLAVALPLGGGPVGYSSGGAFPVAVMQAAIDDASARQQAILARWGPELAPLYEPIASILAWNTMFTPLEGVVTPVSRGWDFGEGYVLCVAGRSPSIARRKKKSLSLHLSSPPPPPPPPDQTGSTGTTFSSPTWPP